VESFFNNLIQENGTLVYVALFLSAYIENIFPPIPGDTVTVIGAYFVGTGKLNFWGVYFSTSVGSIAGFMTLYGLAYWLQWHFIERYRPRWVQRSHLDRVEGWFQQYGYWVVLLNRFLSGARSVISIVAGLSKLNGFLVFFFASISVLLWNGALIYLGAFLGKSWEEIIQYVKLYNKIILVAVVLLLIGVILWYVKKEKNAVEQEVKDE